MSRHPGLTQGMKQELADRYTKGETAPALADEFGISETTVRRIVEIIHPGYRKEDK